jgi:hypothetical protein
MPSTDLQEHIRATYFMLRKGLAALAFALPLVLWIGGRIFGGLSLQQSMSAYYHSGDGVMRDAFVGIMFAVSFFLILYKGFTYFEDWAFNFAGVFLILVALVPMEWGCGTACSSFSAHGTFSLLFFLCIAYVCIFRASDTLDLMEDEAAANRFRGIYRLIGGAMIGAPVIATIISFMLNLEGSESEPRSTLFTIEATCIYIFMAYWIVKSIEITRTKSDKLAMEGKLTLQYQPRDVFRKISVKRIP